MGCMVGFQAVLDQRLAFATLDKNFKCTLMWRHVSRARKQGKIITFSPVVDWVFLSYFLALGLNTWLNRVWNYCYVYWSDLTPFKCWSAFRFFLGLLVSFMHVQLILTSGRQSKRALLSLGKTVVSHLRRRAPPSQPQKHFKYQNISRQKMLKKLVEISVKNVLLTLPFVTERCGDPYTGK